MRHVEKRDHLLGQMGLNVASQRATVFREDTAAFAARLRLFGSSNATSETVEALERGDGSLPMSAWFAAFQAMQVEEAVARSTKNDAALFLAAAQFAPGIEEEMARALNAPESSPGEGA